MRLFIRVFSYALVYSETMFLMKVVDDTNTGVLLDTLFWYCTFFIFVCVVY